MLCSGKIYYDLQEEQEKNKRKDAAIVRVEQLHPFPKTQIEAELKKYKGAEVYWVQEEPENMGYWSYMARVFRSQAMDVISRKASASPATGYGKMHAKEQEAIINKAFDVK